MSSTSIGATQPSGAFPPPPGITPNLEHPAPHLHTANIAAMAACIGLVVISFTVRCYAQWRLSIPQKSEDWTCQCGFVLIVLYVSTCFGMAYYGEGYHAWEITPENYRQLLKWLYASSIVWIPAAFFVKASLLLLTARVFAVYQRVAKAIRIYVVLLAIAYAPVQGVKIFICTPIRHYWDPRVPGTCLDQPKVFLTDTALAIITDLIILAIPIPLTWKLRMPLRKKLKIVAMLGAGGAAVAVACYREYKIYKFQWSTDVSGDFVPMNLCGTFELTIGMVCACLPPINLLIERMRRPRVSSNRSRTRFWPSASSWRGVKRSSNLVSSLRSTKKRTNGGEETYPGEDVESGGLPPEGCTDPSSSSQEVEELRTLHRMDLQQLLRHTSQDGRQEGWLKGTSKFSTKEGSTKDCDQPPCRPAQLTMEQLRQGGGSILIPDRIWDGVPRGLENEHEISAPGKSGQRSSSND